MVGSVSQRVAGGGPLLAVMVAAMLELRI